MKKIKLSVVLFLMGVLQQFVQAQPDSWTQKASFIGGSSAFSANFTINNRGYMVDAITWEYDPVLDVWSQKANFAGDSRSFASGFSVADKGYISCGFSSDSLGNFTSLSDLWQYDPVLNSWTQKADLPSTGRQGAIAFGINSKGYLGTGVEISSSFTYTYFNDFWEYDPLADQWTQKADFPDFSGRAWAVGFEINTRGYLGTGSNGTLEKNDFWEYDPTFDSWIQKASLPSTGRYAAVGFSIAEKGFIGTGLNPTVGGYMNDFWQYNSSTDVWTQKAYFTGQIRDGSICFSLNNKGYIGGGLDGSSGFAMYFDDFWEYTADSVLSVGENNKYAAVKIFPNPASDFINVHFYENTFPQHSINLILRDVKAAKCGAWEISGENQMLDIQHLTSGIYILEGYDKGKLLFKERIVKE